MYDDNLLYTTLVVIGLVIAILLTSCSELPSLPSTPEPLRPTPTPFTFSAQLQMKAATEFERRNAEKWARDKMAAGECWCGLYNGYYLLAGPCERLPLSQEQVERLCGHYRR